MKKTLLLALMSLSIAAFKPIWGFFGHQRINRLAVFTLPPDLIGFYKKNLSYVTRASINPDKRRYAVPEEAARHFMDVDHYSDSVMAALPEDWRSAIKIYPADTLEAHGVLPWHIYTMYVRLRDAFMVRDPAMILKLSAELGHYVADAHVPLHTTKNYNGQLTGQEGIHGLWESRLPELFSRDYDFVVGQAGYIPDPRATAWRIIRSSHALVQRVLDEEKRLGLEYAEKKYSYETRGNTTVKVYAAEFSQAYHDALKGMVEAQMRAAVKAVGDYWFTAWVDAGEPDMRKLIQYAPSKEELDTTREALAELKRKRFQVRQHE